MIKLTNILNELEINNPLLKTWKDKFRQIILKEKKSNIGNDDYYNGILADLENCRSKEDIIDLIDNGLSWGELSTSEYYINAIFDNDKLNEVQHVIYRVEVLIKTQADVNKVFVYNSIRGLTGVVVLTIEQNDYLDTQATNQYEYSLLKMKFMVTSTPKEEINKIKKDALITNKIDGLLQFLPRMQTIEKIGEY